jgi:hypothetical protein
MGGSAVEIILDQPQLLLRVKDSPMPINPTSIIVLLVGWQTDEDKRQKIISINQYFIAYIICGGFWLYPI